MAKVDKSTSLEVTMESRFEQFSSVISGIYRYIQNIEREEMIKYGYKGAYSLYLVTLKRHPEGITATQLGEYCVKDKAGVSRILNQMEEDRLIYREGDAYRARLKLTEKGLEVAEFVKERAHKAVRQVSSDLPEDKRLIMYEVLDLIYSKLEEISEQGLPEGD